jgi:hypothetical protein
MEKLLAKIVKVMVTVKCGGGAGNFLKRNFVGNIAGGGCGGTGYVKYEEWNAALGNERKDAKLVMAKEKSLVKIVAQEAR